MAPTISTKKRRSWNTSFEYKVDYNDHFETPLLAYEDILFFLDELKPTRKGHVLYDPYYCNGRTAVLLRQLGFENVVHAKRDFYCDVREENIPQHDTLITNPPYSDQHKEKCLEFCLQQFRQQKRPFFLLMPNYVASRSYYRQLLGDVTQDVAYIIPSVPYEYDHPEGTGHEVPPFASLWFCAIGREQIQSLQERWKSVDWKFDREPPRFVTSLEELEKLNAIPTQKRPNPRQRKKRRKLNETQHEPGQGKQQAAIPSSKPKQPKSTISGKNVEAASQAKKENSIHRDGTFKRTKKRF
jgi:hypothetical protein